MLIDYHYLQKLTTKSPTNATVVGEREFFEAFFVAGTIGVLQKGTTPMFK